MPGIAPRGGGCLARGPAQPPDPGRVLGSSSVPPTGPSFRCHAHLARANCWRLITATHPDQATNSSGAGKGTRHRAAAPCQPPPAPCLSFPTPIPAQGGRRELPGGCGAGRGGSHGHSLAPHHPEGWMLPGSAHRSPQPGSCPGAGAPPDGAVPGARLLSEQLQARRWWLGCNGAGAVAEGWRAPCPGDAAPFCWALTSGRGPLPQAPPRASFQLST